MIEYLLIVDFCEKTLYEKTFTKKRNNLATSKIFLLELCKNYLLTKESNFVKKLGENFYFFYRSKNSNFFILSSKIKNNNFFNIILQTEELSNIPNFNFISLDNYITQKNEENKLKIFFQKKKKNNILDISNITEQKTNGFSEDLDLERNMLEIINSNENLENENHENENLDNQIRNFQNEKIEYLWSIYIGLVVLIFLNIFLYFKNIN